MTYKTLLFDVDDTILDFQDTEHEALTALFAEQRSDDGSRNETDLSKRLITDCGNNLNKGKLSRDQVVNERFGLFF